MGSTVLRELAAVFEIEWDPQKNLPKGMQQLEGIVEKAKTFIEAISGSKTFGALRDGAEAVREFADEYSEAAGRVKDTADRLGMGYQELQQLQFAARLGGVSATELTGALTKLNMQLGQGEKSKAAKTLRELGIATRTASGEARSASDIMADVARAMGGIESPAQRTAVATSLFGRSGTKLLTILKSGAGGFEDLRGQLEALGGGMSDESIAAADDYGDAMDSLNMATTSFKSVIAEMLLPTLTKIVTATTAGVVWFGKFTKQTREFIATSKALRVVVVLLAALFAVKMYPAILANIRAAVWLAGILKKQLYESIVANVKALKWLAEQWYKSSGGISGMVQSVRTWIAANGAATLSTMAWVAAVALIVLAVEDFIGMMTGADSALGRWLDKTYGAGTQQNVVRSLGEAWDGVKLAVSDAEAKLSGWWRTARTAVSGVWTDISNLASAIGGEFGKAWDAVDEMLGGALSRMWAKVRAFFEPLTRLVSSVGSMIRGGLSSLGDIPANIAKDWRDLVLNLPPAGQQRQQAAVPAPARAGNAANRGSRTTNIGPTTVHVNGVADPERAARRAAEIIEERQRHANDADHPEESSS